MLLIRGIPEVRGAGFVWCFFDRCSFAAAAKATEVHQFTAANSLELMRPIVFEGKRIGTVQMDSDLKEVCEAGCCDMGDLSRSLLLISLPAAALYAFPPRSSRGPRRGGRLCSWQMWRVSCRGRRSILSARLPAGVQDEIALLIGAFNEMLEQIQHRDAALQQAHERLNLALKSSGVGTWSWGVSDAAIAWDDFMYPLFGLATAARTYGGYEVSSIWFTPKTAMMSAGPQPIRPARMRLSTSNSE